DVTVVEVPQVAPIAPYRSHVRTSSTTMSAIVRVETDEGLVGWGEHNVNFLPEISAARMQADARAWTVGRDATNLVAFHRDCRLETRLKSGIELALWDLKGKALGVPVVDLLGGRIRDEVELAACMGIQAYDRAGEIASYYVEQGYTTLKTKAGSDMQEDLEMVRGVRDAVGANLKLRIDPNRAYSLEEATELGRRLEEYELEYLEQPIPAEPLAEAARLRAATKTPIALNESVVDPASAWKILEAGAAEFLLPDTHIAGGIWPCIEIGHLAHAADVPCIMHCGHDLGPKTAAMLHVAGSCPAYTLANDSTYFGLEDDVTLVPFEIKNGRIAVPTVPGLGCDVDSEKLVRYRVEC
ncbi:MAG: mandelate racemase/muconate lactonizing enzyme family protein, partial [Planctomycetaceae bacterium]